MSFTSSWLLVAGMVVSFVHQGAASYGDRSWIFRRCYTHCVNSVRKCPKTDNRVLNQAVYMRVLGWTCTDECTYDCMWETVEAFQKDSSPIPQFYGKWPFIRLLGMQEPLSVLASILNGAGVFYMLLKFRRLVPPSAPMYYVWQFYCIIVMNAWFWSAIFHSRDTSFTEKMDYFCALSLVLASLYTCILRLIGTHCRRKVAIATIVISAFYAQHVYYMGFVHFDYGYNMTVNVAVGVVNATAWITWCLPRRKTKPHVRKCIATNLLISVLLSLELGDFPPVLWIMDAHSLWHLGTIPVPFIWLSFAIDDCLDMNNSLKQTQKVLPTSVSVVDTPVCVDTPTDPRGAMKKVD
ncbi:GPI-specific phospholipase A2-like PGAP3 [Tubulanus polymorphus]|uniref:GPI-specific phospholipase A2-like PGAP3 n=1 Tax=Tubulanus polymorphus TaxID=672921 RepID=UPI003DA5DE68